MYFSYVTNINNRFWIHLFLCNIILICFNPMGCNPQWYYTWSLNIQYGKITLSCFVLSLQSLFESLFKTLSVSRSVKGLLVSCCFAKQDYIFIYLFIFNSNNFCQLLSLGHGIKESRNTLLQED